jgi:hypothetical protein
VQLRHAFGVRAVARCLISVAEQCLDSAEITPFAGGRRRYRGQTRTSRLTPKTRRRQLGQNRARLVDALVVPERLVVGDRLTPVGHGKGRIGALRLPERLDRIVVLEAVEEQHAAQEGWLGLRGARGRERNAAERRRLGREYDSRDNRQPKGTQRPQSSQRQ